MIYSVGSQKQNRQRWLIDCGNVMLSIKLGTIAPQTKKLALGSLGKLTAPMETLQRLSTKSTLRL